LRKARYSADKDEALRLSAESSHGKPTYPLNEDSLDVNFPDSKEAIAAAKKANASGNGTSFLAFYSNQGKLEKLMRADEFIAKKLPGSEATYPEHDSHSWIEPYYPRDHAYTWP
jgi:hypothetical protein